MTLEQEIEARVEAMVLRWMQRVPTYDELKVRLAAERIERDAQLARTYNPKG